MTLPSDGSTPAPPKVNDKASSSDAIDVPPIAREILESYSHIPSDKVDSHVIQIVSRPHSPSR